MSSFVSPHIFLVCLLAGWLNREQQKILEYLQEENRVVREQLGGRLRLSDEQRRRLAAKGKALGRKLLAEVATLVTPDTILRWRRQLVARKWTYPRGKAGRPPASAEIEGLVVRMAESNSHWGYDRIQWALSNLGYKIAPNTVKRILKNHGIEPVPSINSIARFSNSSGPSEYAGTRSRFPTSWRPSSDSSGCPSGPLT